MKVLALPDAGVPPKYKADARIAVGRLAWAADRFEEACSLYAEARPIYESINDEAGSALAEMLMGFVDRAEGYLESAETHFRRAFEVGRKIGRPYLEAGCLSGLGSIALDRGDLSKARELKEESLTISSRAARRPLDRQPHSRGDHPGRDRATRLRSRSQRARQMDGDHQGFGESLDATRNPGLLCQSGPGGR